MTPRSSVLSALAMTWMLLAAGPSVAAPATQPAAPKGAGLAPQVGIEALDFLAGTWVGSDGSSDWESCYTSAAGGQVLGASKEMQQGRVVMIDFEHFYEDAAGIVMRPYPFGKPSVEFRLGAFDSSARKAVFENPEHDFPKKFTYHRNGEETLEITLEGDMGGSEASFVLKLRKQRP